MPKAHLHDDYRDKYMKFMAVRDVTDPAEDLETLNDRLLMDITALKHISQTRYLNGRPKVLKLGNIELCWAYADEPEHHHRFIHMLRVSPLIFDTILALIEDHLVFQNNSNNPQTPVHTQLAVTLYRLGRYGNAASVKDIAMFLGISEGSVENFTDRCITAIKSLHDVFLRALTAAEKKTEKQWILDEMGPEFEGSLWCEGYLMYDGTIVVIYKKPGLNGDAYYTRKSNYGFNVQVRSCIASYSLV